MRTEMKRDVVKLRRQGEEEKKTMKPRGELSTEHRAGRVLREMERSSRGFNSQIQTIAKVRQQTISGVT